jgi:hypothetical protein
MFQVNDIEIFRLRKLIKQSPVKMRAVTAKILNDLAFKTRTEAIKTLKKELIIRQEKFISSTIRVQKAKSTAPMETQVSTIGSIAKRRFSGFEEQELGTETKRTRVASLYGRSGSKSKVIKSAFRLRKNFPSPKDYPGKSYSHRTTVMLQTLNQQKYKKPFVIKKHRKFKPGLYRFLRKRIVPLQHFKPRSLQPKRIKWLSMAYEKTYEQIGLGALWARALKKIFRN